MKLQEQKIPTEILEIGSKLEKAGHQAYLVGGCVRDIAMGRTPNDWDIATDAHPEKLQELFEDTLYENEFGTVGIKTANEDASRGVVEVTTFRTEAEYSDKRHPDKVEFADSIEKDLARRDFTVNAMAGDISSISDSRMEVVDPLNGQADLEKKRLRAVGNPRERFAEDALRMMRAARFAVYLSNPEGEDLDWAIEQKTAQAIRENSASLKDIANERIRDELVKMLETPHAADGIRLLEDLGLLEYIMPELREGIGMDQPRHHIYTVFDHNVRALDYAARNNFPLHLRLAALLHDVGKPKSRRGEGDNATFYGHEVIGARMAKKILTRLHFPSEIVGLVCHLVRHHMFNYDIGEVTESGVRRLLRRVGPEHIDELMLLREADRIGSGVPKAVPYRLRHLKFMFEKVKRDPISVKMLEVNGENVMETAGMAPGPKVGQILNLLLEDVLDDPERNHKDYLQKKIKEYAALPDDQLAKRAQEAKKIKEKEDRKEVEELKRDFHVK